MVYKIGATIYHQKYTGKRCNELNIFKRIFCRFSSYFYTNQSSIIKGKSYFNEILFEKIYKNIYSSREHTSKKLKIAYQKNSKQHKR